MFPHRREAKCIVCDDVYLAHLDQVVNLCDWCRHPRGIGGGAPGRAAGSRYLKDEDAIGSWSGVV